jgi:hypothetical protein
LREATIPYIEATLIRLAVGGPQEVCGKPAEVHNAYQVDLDHSPQVVQDLLLQRPVVADTGVVDQHVEPAMRAQHLDDGLPVPRVGDVAGDGLDPALAVPGQHLEAVGAACGGDDVRACGVQDADKPCPQPGRGGGA